MATYDYTTDYNNIKNRINSNTAATPQYQSTNAAGEIASNYLNSLAPVKKSINDQIDQNTYNSQRGLREYLGATGQSRGGVGINRTIGLQNYGNQQKGAAYGNLVNAAMSAAPTMANLALNEQNQIYNQNATTASQLSSLLNQQQGNQFTEAGLTGTYNGAPTLAQQSLTNQNQQYINQLAAAIMAAYAQGTDQFTLPSSVTSRLNTLFTS